MDPKFHAVREFASLILHGDQEHRRWLIEACEAYCEGRELPAPRGGGLQQLRWPALRIGTRVRMNEAYKAACVAHGMLDHAREFGDCIGVVEGPTFVGYPEVDVRWSVAYAEKGLRYSYHPDNLVVVSAASSEAW